MAANDPKVRIAVAGAGLIGRKHIDVLRTENPLYELAGVADPSPAARADAEALGYTHSPNLEQLLDQVQPDGVIIAVPNQAHCTIGLACVARGLPILIEKPVADTVRDALRLVEAAEKANVATLTGHHRRHNPIMQTAASVIRDGTLGLIVTATSMWLSHKPAGYHDAAWRREPGGGPVLINAIHDVDCLRMLLGDIATVQAMQSNAVRGFDVEDTAAALLRFKSGALGTLILSDTVSSPWSWETTSGENPAFPVVAADAITVSGTRGSLSVPSLQIWSQTDGAQSWLAPLVHDRKTTKRADPYELQMQNFAEVIRGTAAPILDGRDGTLTLATTLAITASATTGQPVHVDDLMMRHG